MEYLFEILICVAILIVYKECKGYSLRVERESLERDNATLEHIRNIANNQNMLIDEVKELKGKHEN